MKEVPTHHSLRSQYLSFYEEHILIRVNCTISFQTSLKHAVLQLFWPFSHKKQVTQMKNRNKTDQLD